MKKIPQISDAEYEVMKIVWEYAPISTNEVTARLTEITEWSPKTIQTLLKRLVTKEALTYEKQGRVFVYTPLVKEQEYIRQKSSSFVRQYFHGDLTAMILACLDSRQLSETEITSLRELLNEKIQ